MSMTRKMYEINERIKKSLEFSPMTKSIDEWAATKCGVLFPQHGDMDRWAMPNAQNWNKGKWTIKDPRCREIVRERYRKKGWVITFTIHSVIYHLPTTEQDQEIHCYTRDSEEDCITAIYEAENIQRDI